MKIFKFLTILALGTNALSEREQRRQARREEIERDGELGEEDAKVSLRSPYFGSHRLKQVILSNIRFLQ